MPFKIHPEPNVLPLDNQLNPASSKVSRRWRFFCCSTMDEAAVADEGFLNGSRSIIKSSSHNPVPDTVKLLGFADQDNQPLTAFLVVQAIKDGELYKTPIHYVSPQAEVILKSADLPGTDLAQLMIDPDFAKMHSKLIGTFFENYLKTGKNTSSFIGKGLHGLRDLPIRLTDGEQIKLHFTLSHTITQDPKTKKPKFYMIAHLPSDLELNKQRQLTQPLYSQIASLNSTNEDDLSGDIPRGAMGAWGN